MKKYWILMSFILQLSAIPYVWGAEDNPCGILHIQIANLTEHSCVLVESHVIHGVLQGFPPSAILSNDSKHFDVVQTLHGPEIILKYDCGGKQISFFSKQDFCWLSAGKIKAYVFSSAAELDAFYTVEMGSSFWKKPGAINWNINSKR